MNKDYLEGWDMSDWVQERLCKKMLRILRRTAKGGAGNELGKRGEGIY
jgi:hypothetical protein